MPDLIDIPRAYLAPLETRLWNAQRPQEGTYTLYVCPRAYHGGRMDLHYIEDENEPGLLFCATHTGLLATTAPVARITP